MNFEIISEILTKCANQFIEDEFQYLADRYDSFYNLKTLSTREKGVIEQQKYDMFQELNYKITLPFYCSLMVQSIVNSNTSRLLVNQKYYTNKLLFVTFRPSDEMDMKTFKDISIKFLEKDIIQSYIIVYEQKGNSYATLGQGKHFHALIQFNFKSQFKTYKQQISKYFTGKGIYELIDVNKQQFIIDKIVYLGLTINKDENTLINSESLKYKDTEKKNESLSYDRLFQRKNELDFQIKNENEILGLCGLSY